MLSPAPSHFDRSKPFYPLVLNYVVQILGLKELAFRGLAGPREFSEVLKQIPALGQIPPGREGDVATVRDNLQKLMGPLQLRSEFLDTTIEVDGDEMAQEVASNSHYLANQLMRSAGILLILAHELNKDEFWHDGGLLWEFLRHCRNGAARGGRFHFLHGEPRRPASWGRFQISSAMERMPVFGGGDTVGLLSPGDPLRLLWDIEEAYPAMKVRT
jgi:hypothetical protein